MTPSNTQKLPLIQRIFDSLGADHTVTPTPHTHTQDEVSGLTNALAAKADTSAVTTNLAAKADKVSGATNDHLAALDSNGNLKDSGKAAGDFMPAMTIDTTPTSGSTNLVTSGGVKTALDNKQDTLIFDTTPTAESTNPVTSGGVKTALDDKADKNHMHSAIGDEYSSVAVGDGEINIELSDPVTHSGGELDITVNKLPNLQRAINNPDSTPTANSDNLVTSGGVYEAVVSKVTAAVGEIELDATTTIDVDDLDAGRVYKVERSGEGTSGMTIESGFGFLFGAKWCGTVSKTTVSNRWFFRYYSIPTGAAPTALIELLYAS